MRSLTHPYFLAALAGYLCIRIMQQLDVVLPLWIQSYGADVLCMPIVFSLILALVRKIKKNAKLQLPLSAVLFVFLYWSVYFEYYLPSKDKAYTGDIWDILMYAIGTSLFLIWQKAGFDQTIRKPDYQQ